jgi:hypothetical protein
MGLRPILPLVFALAVCFGLTPEAHAGSITAFSLQFTLTNTNADGSVQVSGDGLSVALTGGNNGSGLPGTTDFLTSALADGVVNFAFSYASLDTPTFDFAGYLLGSTFVQLADTDGEFGNATFPVTLGESFGFRVGTVDNEGEPGILTVSNFSAPGSAAIPEPGTLPLAILGTAAILAFKGMRFSGYSPK